MKSTLPRLSSLLRRGHGFSATEAANAISSHRHGDGFGSEALNVAGGSAKAITHAFARRRYYAERDRAVATLQARRQARGMADPLNRLRAYTAAQVAAGAPVIVAMEA